MLNDIAKTTLYLSTSGSFFTLVLLSLKLFIQNRFSKKWYYYIWVIVIIRMIVPYGLPFNIISNMVNPKTDYTEEHENDTTANSALPSIINENTGFQSQRQIETPILKDINEGIRTDVVETIAEPAQKDFFDYFKLLSPFLGLIWFSTALIILIKKLFSYYHFARFVKSRSKSIDDDAVLKVCADICQSFGIKKEFPVFTHQSINSPMLIGLLKPVIVLPEKQMENMPQLKYVFMHELTHYKHFDIFYKWFMQIVLCVHWFNPIAYLVGKEVNKACELSCDEAVIKKLSFQEQRAYGDTLLRSLELLGSYNNSSVSLTLAENSKLMKERLGAIMKFRKKSKLAVFVSAFSTFILCTGAAFTGVQAATITNNKEIIASNITDSSVTSSDLQNFLPVPNTSIRAHTYNGNWASATGIEADTYKKQLDEKIRWAEELYNEKKERFMLNETISEKEVTNTLGIQYMYEKSSIYRDLANTGGMFRLLPYDSSFSRTGSKKYYERSVFYVDQASVMNLRVFYELSEGKLGLYVVSPEGNVVYAGNPVIKSDNNVVLPLSSGLWSIVIINESETGTIKGTQKIEATIASSENFTIPINISQLKTNETITLAGPYYLSKNDAWSVQIDSWDGEGSLFVADMKEGESFNHSVVMEKAPDGFAFLADESRYYYITIGNVSDIALTNIKGKLTLNYKGDYQSPKNKDEQTTLSNSNANEINIDIPQIAPDGHKSYGPYNLKKGDIVSSDLTWSNDAGLYFSIGKEFMNFKGFYSSYNKYGEYMKKDIIVQEDGIYYIFVGNPSTFEPEVKNVVGTITINNTTSVTRQNDVGITGENTKLAVNIPSVSENGFVKPYGKYYLSKDDNVYAEITWKGKGYVMFLYTKENLSTNDIAALIDSGVLPLGGGGKFLGAGTEITSNFTYQSQKKEIVYNLTTSADEICKTMSVPSEGDYYFYVIAKSDTEITNIKGDIIFNKKVNSTYKTGDKLPHMSVWIGSAGEKETSTGIIFNAKNYTGDKTNYEFLSEENGNKTLKLNSSLTGEYEIIFVTSDRTIVEKISPFTGNKEITLTGLPKDTISMKVYSNNVSGSLSVDSEAPITKK